MDTYIPLIIDNAGHSSKRNQVVSLNVTDGRCYMRPTISTYLQSMHDAQKSLCSNPRYESRDEGIAVCWLFVCASISDSRAYYTDCSSCTWSHLVRRYSRLITSNAIGVINTRGAENKGTGSVIYIGVYIRVCMCAGRSEKCTLTGTQAVVSNCFLQRGGDREETAVFNSTIRDEQETANVEAVIKQRERTSAFERFRVTDERDEILEKDIIESDWFARVNEISYRPRPKAVESPPFLLPVPSPSLRIGRRTSLRRGSSKVTRR